MADERPLIVYHGQCPDGFGGAYAAWKKFGTGAEYLPLTYNDPVPGLFEGRTVYFIDFCYEQEIMERIEKDAECLVVLDHHQGTKDVVERMKEHVYDEMRSGATIAWNYFHPEKSVPVLLKYVEAGDLYRFDLVDAHELLTYLYTRPFTFEAWEQLEKRVADTKERSVMVERGKIYLEYKAHIIQKLVDDATLIRFEGYTCLLSPTLRVFTSELGNLLAKKQPPFSLTLQARHDGIRVSLRGTGEVDVAALARKYGGNGHPNAAAFSLPHGSLIPWERVEEKDIA